MSALSREILEQNRIFFQENPSEVHLTLRHTKYLRSALLDFECTLSDRYSLQHESDIRELDWDRAFKEVDAHKAEVEAVTSKIEWYKKTTSEAQFRHEGGDREDEWQSYYTQFFLKPLETATQVSEGDARRIARVKFYYDAFELWVTTDAVNVSCVNGEDSIPKRRWTLFDKTLPFRNKKPGLTMPVPDNVAYFPVYDLESGSRTRSSRRWHWPDNPRDGLVENFSRLTFQHLARHGLEPSPAGAFGEKRRSKIKMSDLLCYPWLIVEHKKDDSENKATECYCQAANAAQAALTMHQILTKYAKNTAYDMHVPPVTTMTTVGKEVKIWIAYVSNRGRDYDMECIWTGDVTLALDVIKLEAILENLHTWAVRELRPWISSCLDQWLRRFPLHNTDKLQSASRSGLGPDMVDEEDMALAHTADGDNIVHDSPNSLTAGLRELFRSEHEDLLKRLLNALKRTSDKDVPERYPAPSISTPASRDKLSSTTAMTFKTSTEEHEDSSASTLSSRQQKQVVQRQVAQTLTRSCWTQTHRDFRGQETGWVDGYDPFAHAIAIPFPVSGSSIARKETIDTPARQESSRRPTRSESSQTSVPSLVSDLPLRGWRLPSQNDVLKTVFLDKVERLGNKWLRREGLLNRSEKSPSPFGSSWSSEWMSAVPGDISSSASGSPSYLGSFRDSDSRRSPSRMEDAVSSVISSRRQSSWIDASDNNQVTEVTPPVDVRVPSTASTFLLSPRHEPFSGDLEPTLPTISTLDFLHSSSEVVSASDRRGRGADDTLRKVAEAPLSCQMREFTRDREESNEHGRLGITPAKNYLVPDDPTTAIWPENRDSYPLLYHRRNSFVNRGVMVRLPGQKTTTCVFPDEDTPEHRSRLGI